VFVSVKHIQKEKKLYAFTGTQTNVVCFQRVLPSRFNTVDHLRVRQKTTVSQHPSVEAELASSTPQKIIDL
jgi:predicted amino acid racemase